MWSNERVRSVLGIMGFADLCLSFESYLRRTQDSIELMEKVMGFVRREAWNELRCSLGAEKGTFPELEAKPRSLCEIPV